MARRLALADAVSLVQKTNAVDHILLAVDVPPVLVAFTTPQTDGIVVTRMLASS